MIIYRAAPTQKPSTLRKIAQTTIRAAPLTRAASNTTNEVTIGFCIQIERELKYTDKNTSDMAKALSPRMGLETISIEYPNKNEPNAAPTDGWYNPK
jgi:hypothetical protein